MKADETALQNYCKYMLDLSNACLMNGKESLETLWAKTCGPPRTNILQWAPPTFTKWAHQSSVHGTFDKNAKKKGTNPSGS